MPIEFKVVLPAYRIPSNSRVTKPTGSVQYMLTRSIRVYGDADQRREVAASGGTVFLIDPRTGNANAMPGTTELLWVTSRSGLDKVLDPDGRFIDPDDYDDYGDVERLIEGVAVDHGDDLAAKVATTRDRLWKDE